MAVLEAEWKEKISRISNINYYRKVTNRMLYTDFLRYTTIVSLMCKVTGINEKGVIYIKHDKRHFLVF